jgi:hypothetical protein
MEQIAIYMSVSGIAPSDRLFRVACVPVIGRAQSP